LTNLDPVAAERHLSSRRGFLTGSAALLAGAALVSVPGMAKAHTTSEATSDEDILNYALTLEHLEATFYVEGLKKFEGNIKNNRTRANFRRIRNHEVEHVKTLEDVIRSLGGEPVPPCRYNFKSTAFTSKKKFYSVAQFLENTGVKAYDGAIAHIQRAQLLTAGATIATVEARHASYLNFLNRDIPFPDAFDEAVAPRTICEAIKAENGGFITSCPEPYGPYRDLDELCALLPTTTS
jgi:rubrerythrin